MDDTTIVIGGVPRSASTFVYQVVKDLFPDCNVEKVHGNDNQRPLLVTYRNLRDVVVSMWKAWSRSGMMGQELTKEGVDRILDEISPTLNVVNAHDSDVLWLQYEHFVPDHDVLYDALETFFHIEILQETREGLSSQYGLAANRMRAAKLSDFRCVDTETQIHGYHIYKGKSGYVDEVSSEIAVYLSEKVWQLLQGWDCKKADYYSSFTRFRR